MKGKEYLRVLRKMVDGVIYMSSSLQPEYNLINELNIKTVLVETKDKEETTKCNYS